MPKKVLVFQMMHETNAFCPSPANMTAFKNGFCAVGEGILPTKSGIGTCLGGIHDAFESRPDIELIPSVRLYANPCGPVTREVFDFAVEHVLATLREKGPVDGMDIVFHGAMVAEGHPDAEGDFLEILRNEVGWEIPIVASLDLHANITAKMAKCATALVPYQYYPHTDANPTALVASQILIDALDGKTKPVMAYRRIPHLLPLVPTAFPAFRPLYDLADQLQARPGVLCVRFTHGFYAADIEEMGMSVLVTTDGDRELAESVADELAAAIDRDKDKLRENYLTLDEALDRAMEPGDGPYVIADTSDNPGGGGLGNTTHILRRVLERGITGGAFAVIVDPESVCACEQAGAGATLELQLGGKKGDDFYSGGALPVTAYVRAITDGAYCNKGPMNRGITTKLGKTAIVEIAGNLVVISSLAEQPLDLEAFRHNGIEPADCRFLVVKSAIHYRASYGTVAREMVPVPLHGYISPTPENFRYRNWKGKV